MSRAVVEVLEWTCDECGDTEDVELGTVPKGWQAGPPDLCPGCKKEAPDA